MTPLDVVVKILNNQLTSLMWIDEKVSNLHIGIPWPPQLYMLCDAIVRFVICEKELFGGKVGIYPVHLNKKIIPPSNEHRVIVPKMDL